LTCRLTFTRLKQASAWFKVHDRGATTSPSRTSPPGSPLQRPNSPPRRRRRRRPPLPHGEQRAARAVAGSGAPMPRGFGRALPPAPQARSHDVTTACGTNRVARKSPRGRKKVAGSGRIRVVFEHPCTCCTRGGMMGRHIRRRSPAIGHRTGLGTVLSCGRADRRPSSASASLNIVRYSGRALPASTPGCRPISQSLFREGRR
jgi:hypothetical protein